MNYCRNLDFEENPNYSYLRKIFRQLYRRHFNYYDYEFDWKNPTLLKERELAKAETAYEVVERERERDADKDKGRLDYKQKSRDRDRDKSTHKGTDDLRNREKSFVTTRGVDLKSDRSPLERKREKVEMKAGVLDKPTKHARRTARRK